LTPNLSTPLPFPFRIGTTSYILADDILPNVRFLAGQIQDVELLIYESTESAGPLLSASDKLELAALACTHDLTYTVDLPLDMRLGAEGGLGTASNLSARRTIEATQDLHPWAYIVHLDTRGQLPTGWRPDDPVFLSALRGWQNRAAESLSLLGEWAGGAEFLAVENLEGTPFEWITPILAHVPASRCVDVGHLWLDGIDPLAHLQQARPSLRVLHLHGIAGHDHASLKHVAPERLDALSAWLLKNFTGVATLEIFGLEDFQSSASAFMESLRRSSILQQEGA
jgi:sugar phosphate isomerase/epimerase